jgi:uncharacterized protein
MKRIATLALALFFLAVIPQAVFASSLGAGAARVFDYAGLMSVTEINSLETLIADLRAKYGMDIVVLTSNDASTDASLAYADDFYDNHGFGTGPDRDGLLYFIDMHNRVPTISTSGLMIRYVTDDRLKTLLNTAYDYLDQGKYAAGTEITLTLLRFYLQQGIPSGQFTIDEAGNRSYASAVKTLTFGEMAASLGAGALAALIFIGVIKHRYELKGSAYQYDLQANTTVSLTGATDEYLRTDVVRTRRQTSSSGGGGFSSSTHRSSGGRTHGGGSGRRF